MLKITLITLGNKMPEWVDAGVNEFKKRLTDRMPVHLIEIPLIKRGKSSDLARILDKEMQLMKAQIPTNAYCIALDVKGIAHTSEALAEKLQQLAHFTQHLCFLIGGPEGLSPSLLDVCSERWSLSKLTLPHMLARIVLIEALYRAWSINQNHPYHK